MLPQGAGRPWRLAVAAGRGDAMARVAGGNGEASRRRGAPKRASATAQWGLDRVPYGSADSVLQAVAGSPQSAKWLQTGPFCAGSLLAQQISGTSARMISALSLLVWIIRMLRPFAARALLLLHASITPGSRGVISLPPKGSRYRPSAADVMLKTCAASAAQWHDSTDLAQNLCAATGVRQRPATFYQQISCRS